MDVDFAIVSGCSDVLAVLIQRESPVFGLAAFLARHLASFAPRPIIPTLPYMQFAAKANTGRYLPIETGANVVAA